MGVRPRRDVGWSPVAARCRRETAPHRRVSGCRVSASGRVRSAPRRPPTPRARPRRPRRRSRPPAPPCRPTVPRGGCRRRAAAPGWWAGRRPTRTSRALDPSDGPTIPRDSSRSISRPALANPTRSLRWSIDVDPNWVVTTSSVACSSRSRSSPMSSSTCFFGATTDDVLAVVRLELLRDALDDRVDLGLRDPGTLDADRLARAHRQEQRVTLTDELLGARLVQDDPGVGQRRRRERHPRRHVGLDQTGHDVDRGPLGREDQVDPGRPGELGDPDDGLLDVARATIMRSASSSTMTSRYG